VVAQVSRAQDYTPIVRVLNRDVRHCEDTF
jgi:hypothetical protein